MTTWEVLLYSGGSQVNPGLWTSQSDLPRAFNKNLQLRLNSPHEFSFTLNGNDPDAALITELSSDIVIKRDGEKLFRGRIGPSDDTLTEKGHQVNFRAWDYRELLKRRILFDGDSALDYAEVTAREQEAIAWEMIANTQARTNGDLGITRGGSQTTGVTRNRLYEAGSSIGELIQQLSEVDDGFLWEIDPDLVYRVRYPAEGTLINYTLDYGGNVATITRNVEASDYANVVRVTGGAPEGGGSAPTPVTNVGPLVELGIEQAGRWEKQIGDQSWVTQEAVDERAASLIEGDQIILPTYVASLVPDVWGGPDSLWLGDIVTLIVKAGRLNVDTEIRLIEMSINFDNTERIQCVLGAPSMLTKLMKQNQKILSELTTLQRR